MNLFEQVLGAINNPNQQGNQDQLAAIINAASQIAGQQGIDPQTTQTVLSIVGNYAQSALRQNPQQAQNLVNQYGGTSSNLRSVDALFTPELKAQLIGEISQRTGIQQQQIESLLPLAVPVILNLLQMGNDSGGSGNSVLQSFLDADGSGQVDVGDAIQLGLRFLNQPK
jgi:hypothetical protein